MSGGGPGAWQVDSTPLLVAAVLAPFAALALHALQRRLDAARIARLGEPATVRRMMAARSPGRRLAKALVGGLALGLVLLAAARPFWLERRARTQESLDVVFAVDVSKSMLVGDVEVAEPPGGWPADLPDDAPRPVPGDATWVRGTRLERARQLLTLLAPRLPDDRIGVLAFAGASIHFPLTDDEDLAVRLVHQLGPSDLAGGSDVGEALRVGTCLLRDDVRDPRASCGGIGVRGRGGDPLPGEDDAWLRRRAETRERGERGKAIVVLTDGGAAGSVAAEADLARQLGVTLVFVGVGTDEGGVVPELDARGEVIGSKLGADGAPVRSRLDRDGLRQLAALAGGADRYVELPPAGPLDAGPLVAALARVPRGPLETTERARRREGYPAPLLAGFVLLLVEAAIGLRRRVRYPEGAA